jgi:meiotically up-regulated gene 157 (Mug157) protein
MSEFDRRTFLGSGLALATIAAAPTPSPISNGRPAVADRRFTSPAIERAIADVRRKLGPSQAARKLGDMFANCFPNTLDTTVEFDDRPGRPDTFVLTGDIAAMWLRDSTAQVWPYLTFAKQDARLQRLIAGVINRQSACVLLDPYANAFNKEPSTVSEWASDDTEMKPGLHERKWEVDSLCNTIRLAHGYWRATGDTSPFGPDWRHATRVIVDTFRIQQRKHDRGPYRFQRKTSWQSDTAPGAGWGNPIKPVGLIVSLFRPSDDAAILPFLVPANMFAVVSLRQLAEMQAITGDAAFAAECRAMADEVAAALNHFALVEHPHHGRIWAYEVDGFGGQILMDDANVPSLLSLPYLGWCAADDPIYRNTRAFVLSTDNPWFHKGRVAEGVGSPHTPGNRIWPIAIVMRPLTSRSDPEITAALRMLIATDAGTGFIHEAFDPDDPAQYSRPWFAWANTLFGEMVLKIASERPALLKQF